MKSPTTREILEAMHAKAPAPKSGPVLGGGAVGVKSVLFERVKEAREAGKRLGLVERIKAGVTAAPEPGDIYIVNDPYLGGTHLMDVRFARPFFVVGALFCWLQNTGHWPDTGGMVPGGFSDDANYMVRAWQGVIAYLLMDYRFLYE